MFDIKIGTVVPAQFAKTMIPQLNEKGFECYELDFNNYPPQSVDFSAYAEEIASVLNGRSISACGYYKNPIQNESDAENLQILLKNLPKLNCSILGAFAGGIRGTSVPETLPQYVKAWKPLADTAAENGVKIGFEGCGGGWKQGTYNIAFCADAWDAMFDSLPHEALGLEWEPCHALERLADPILQLRKYAGKVVHIHGKDATVAWDILREHGIDSPAQYVWNRTPSFGDTNWADVFTILLQHGFQGACDIEGYHDPVHFDDMEWTAQLTALEYLKRCRGGASYYEGPTEYRGYQGARRSK